MNIYSRFRVRQMVVVRANAQDSCTPGRNDFTILSFHLKDSRDKTLMTNGENKDSINRYNQQGDYIHTLLIVRLRTNSFEQRYGCADKEDNLLAVNIYIYI